MKETFAWHLQSAISCIAVSPRVNYDILRWGIKESSMVGELHACVIKINERENNHQEDCAEVPTILL